MAEIIPYSGGEQAALQDTRIPQQAATRFQQAAVRVGALGRESADYLGRGIREAGAGFTEAGQILKAHAIHGENVAVQNYISNLDVERSDALAKINQLPADQRSAALGAWRAEAQAKLASVGENLQFDENRSRFAEEARATTLRWHQQELATSAQASADVTHDAGRAFDARSAATMSVQPNAMGMQTVLADFNRVFGPSGTLTTSPAYLEGTKDPAIARRNADMIAQQRQKTMIAAARMAVQQNPDSAPAIIRQFAGELGPEGLAEIQGLGQRVTRENEYHARFLEAENRRAERDAAEDFHRQLDLGMLDPNSPDGLRVDPNAMENARRLGSMPRSSPNAATTYLRYNAKIQEEQAKEPKEKPQTDAATLMEMEKAFADPTADMKPYMSVWRELKAEGQIDNKTLSAFLWRAKADPLMRAAQSQFVHFLNDQVAKGLYADTHEIQHLGRAPFNVQAFAVEMQRRFDAGKAAGEKTEDLLDPTSKVYIGRNYVQPILPTTPLREGQQKPPLQEFFAAGTRPAPMLHPGRTVTPSREMPADLAAAINRPEGWTTEPRNARPGEIPGPGAITPNE